MKNRWLSIGFAVGVLHASGCGKVDPGTGGHDAGSNPADSGGAQDAAIPASDGSEASQDLASASTDGAPYVPGPFLCSQEPPQGAVQADPLPTYPGQCPQLLGAPTLNMITSSGVARKFMVVIPANLQPTEKLPVLFMWYWLKGNAADFLQRGDVQPAVDQERFIAVIPVALGDLAFEWPFNVVDADARLNQEFQFFDDMLACVAQQFPTINRNCVGSVGVSAGALFTDSARRCARQPHLIHPLVLRRRRRRHSQLGESGAQAAGGGAVGRADRPVPRSTQLPDAVAVARDRADAAGDFLIECQHNCGHGEPPVDPPYPGASKYAAMWGFIFDHPFWLGPGESPYKNGLPPTFPSWCAIGQGKATPRTGMCGKPGC